MHTICIHTDTKKQNVIGKEAQDVFLCFNFSRVEMFNCIHVCKDCVCGQQNTAESLANFSQAAIVEGSVNVTSPLRYSNPNQCKETGACIVFLFAHIFNNITHNSAH